MKSFKIGIHKVSIPSSWKEVNTATYLQLLKASDEVTWLTILTGLPVDVIRNCSIKTFKKIADHIRFTHSLDTVTGAKPPVVLRLNDKYITAPASMDLEKYGLFVLVDERLKESFDKAEVKPGTPEPHATVKRLNAFLFDIPFVVACYLYKPYNNLKELEALDFENRIHEFEKVILEHPCTDIIPLGTFFLNKFLNSKLGEVSSLSTIPSPKKYRPVLIALAFMVILTLLILLLAAIYFAG
ncbi:hypothetical protein FW774_05920 [Pedobacter sp. BS3]|uniref:hypothetical protein n=1 Tax=Pedobacter sp. BS3 TaxID=2567937 RepID=UPI0011ECDEE6|nr:hypothetical protein [Pedobacter sp. BS3]TZF84524.1 hypothetical protein FW774_05920 [Pedobacter sp. BS3]